MSILEKRRAKVERLTALAIQDRLPHKYVQGRFIMDEIDRRIAKAKNNYIHYLKQLR